MAGWISPIALAADGGNAVLATLGTTAALILLPLLVIAGTSFLKFSVVFGILRSAFGAPGVPPSTVLTALAAVLSLFVMAPVGTRVWEAAGEIGSRSSAGAGETRGIAETKELFDAASPPLKDFLNQNTPAAEKEFFAELAGLPVQGELGLRVLLPAFAIGELVEAFIIGVFVFLPFMVIDLIVSMSLLALGMHMLSPVAIALPLKLLLFVTVDGWHLLLSGIIVNYSF